ncbi:MAG: acyl-CoA dehydratase activase [Deltaproteobacteria bacterium]|nr:acyl-CoA dehydratase activase [Deltaproteobacteria bacterium]
MNAIGLDCGSSWCKGAWLDKNLNARELISRPAGWNLKKAIEEVLETLRELTGPGAIVAATGYGRGLVAGAKLRPTEIGCHAKGAEFLASGTRSVIDIGGQDTKAIGALNGKVLTFQMNDRCAAGTGRFLEKSLERLSLNLEDIDLITGVSPASVASLCAVFAESEIMSLLFQGVSRESIALGVVEALAEKAASLLSKIKPLSPVALTGGLCQCRTLAKTLSKASGVQVINLERGRHAGAIGAALLALSA